MYLPGTPWQAENDEGTPSPLTRPAAHVLLAKARGLSSRRMMSMLIDMKRVTIAAAKQSLPALVHEAEQLGEIELTRRGKPVAYLVSAEQHARNPRRRFVESLHAWLAVYADDLGTEPLTIPPRLRARKVELFG